MAMKRNPGSIALATACLWLGFGVTAKGQADPEARPPSRITIPSFPANESRKSIDRPAIKLKDLAKGGVEPQLGYIQGLSKDGTSLEMIKAGAAPSIFENRVIEREEEVEEGGKIVTKVIKEERKILVPLMNVQASVVAIPLDKLRVYDVEGRRIPASKVEELFARPRPVSYSYEGMTVDPKFLAALREGTPFLVFPMSLGVANEGKSPAK